MAARFAGTWVNAGLLREAEEVAVTLVVGVDVDEAAGFLKATKLRRALSPSSSERDAVEKLDVMVVMMLACELVMK